MIFKRNKSEGNVVNLQSSRVKAEKLGVFIPASVPSASIVTDSEIQELKASLESTGLTIEVNKSLNCCHQVRVSDDKGNVFMRPLRVNTTTGHYFPGDIVKLNDGISVLMGE